MKSFLLFCFLFVMTAISYGQLSNLTVNGSSTNFSMASGDELGWSYNVPVPGDTSVLQIWIDTDQNGVLNKSVDKMWTFFEQIDGDRRGHNGPPDMDDSVNGHVFFQMKLGLAPAHYILLFSNHGHYYPIKGVVTELLNPTTTVSGTLSVPAGFDKANINFSIENKDSKDVPFWNALTDANGNFTIKLKVDTAGTYDLSSRNNYNFGSAVLSPLGYSFTIDPAVPSYTGKDFNLTAASAEIRGSVKDESGNPVFGTEVRIMSNNGSVQNFMQTDTMGNYRLGLTAAQLPQTNLHLSAGENPDTVNVTPDLYLASVASGDVITKNLYFFKANSYISGIVTLEGQVPNYTVGMVASNSDSCNVYTFADLQGHFNFRVTDKIFNYYVGSSNQGGQPLYGAVIAHPGDTNVHVNLTITDVKQVDSNIPGSYNLSQNYPNPFNPSTAIKFSIAKEGHVKLTVYNALGSQVAVPVDEYKPAGNYEVQFNGSNLASGVYFYKLESGSFSAIKKFILLK